MTTAPTAASRPGPHEDQQRALYFLDYAINLLCYAAESWTLQSYDGRQLWLSHIAQSFYAVSLKLGLDVRGQLDFAFAANSVRYGFDYEPLLPHLDYTRYFTAFLDLRPGLVEALAALARPGTSTPEERARVMDYGRLLIKELRLPARVDCSPSIASPPHYLAMVCFILGEARRIADGEDHSNEYGTYHVHGSPEENQFFRECYDADPLTRESVSCDTRRMAVEYAAYVMRTGTHAERPATARSGANCAFDAFLLASRRGRPVGTLPPGSLRAA